MSRGKAAFSSDELEILLDRVKFFIGSKKDADVVRALKVASSSIPTWRKRGTVPYADLVHFAYRNDISLDELFYGGPHEQRFVSEEGEDSPAELLKDIDEALEDLPDASDIEPGHEEWEIHLDPSSVGTIKESARALARLATKGGCDDFVLVPRYDVEGSMGAGAIIHSEQIVDYLAFKSDWVRHQLGAKPANLVLISAVGDSMEPSLSSGDLLLVDKSECQFRDDGVYILVVNGALLVKRIQHQLDGTIVIKSDNPAYEPQTIEQPEIESLQILGRVVWSGRRM